MASPGSETRWRDFPRRLFACEVYVRRRIVERLQGLTGEQGETGALGDIAMPLLCGFDRRKEDMTKQNMGR